MKFFRYKEKAVLVNFVLFFSSCFGDLEHVSKAISGHSYFTTSPFSKMIQHREKRAAAVNEIPDLEFWMSEYCILGGKDGEIEGDGRDLGIDPAFYMARVIHRKNLELQSLDQEEDVIMLARSIMTITTQTL